MVCAMLTGMLPLEGAIPDMTATTEAYLALQQCYRQKALADMEAVARRCGELAVL